jgi:hypothetical protein
MRGRWTTGTALLGAVALVAAGCGSAATPEPAGRTTRPPVDLASGSWLLRFTTETGSEGEGVGGVYVTLVPATGRATVRKVPSLSNPDTYSDAAAVLVSADHTSAVLDSRVPVALGRRGVLRVYDTAAPRDHLVDVRALTGRSDVVPVAAAFDPARPRVLRVVDTRRRVWALDLAAGTGAREGSLPSHPGWIYANGFDKNTGLPYLEARTTEATLPAGNGADDVRAVRRQGGEMIDEDVEHSDEPALPCGFASAFRTSAGETWLFCADTPRITTYRLPAGATAWKQVGTPTAAVLPGSASELPVVLPPVG